MILVVDDEPQIRRLLRASLEMSGYDVMEAATGQEAIEQSLRGQPDVMLLDLGLPDMDGNTVLKRFREWSQAPVMVVSVRRQEDEKITALDNGANDYVTKPFGTGELLARLRVMRRNAQPKPRPEVFCSGDLTVDTVARNCQSQRPVGAPERHGIFAPAGIRAERREGADTRPFITGRVGNWGRGKNWRPAGLHGLFA